MRERRKEIKKRDQALKQLEKIEEHLLTKLSEQVQVQREITEELFEGAARSATGSARLISGLAQKKMIKLHPVQGGEEITLNTIDEDPHDNYPGSALPKKKGKRIGKKKKVDANPMSAGGEETEESIIDETVNV
jgi:hypothetical protein